MYRKVLKIGDAVTVLNGYQSDRGNFVSKCARLSLPPVRRYVELENGGLYYAVDVEAVTNV